MNRKPRSSVSPREAVLSAALELFSTKGYFATSVPDIVAAAGVSVGALYHHFKDKLGIARAMYAAAVEGLEAGLSDAIAGHDDARSRCRAIIALLFRLAEQEPRRTAFLLQARHREFLPDEPPVCSSRPFRMMRDVVVQGIAAGEIRPLDPYVAAAALYGGALRLVLLRLDGVLEQPLPHYLDEISEAGWRAVSA